MPNVFTDAVHDVDKMDIMAEASSAPVLTVHERYAWYDLHDVVIEVAPPYLRDLLRFKRCDRAASGSPVYHSAANIHIGRLNEGA